MPTEHPALRIERFNPARHDRADFDCGVGRLDNYLKLSARKQQKDDMTRVHVVVEEGSSRVLGYHAVNLGMMNASQLERRPRGTPDHGEIPVLFLGQVAVDERQQGRGLGGILMHHVFEKACVIADAAGCHAILLDVISDGGEAAFSRRKSWYESFGFAAFASNPARMFLAMKQVRAVVQKMPRSRPAAMAAPSSRQLSTKPSSQSPRQISGSCTARQRRPVTMLSTPRRVPVPSWPART